MTCPSCESPVASSDSFCEACGTELTPTAAPAAPADRGLAAPTVRSVPPRDPADPLEARAPTCIACGGDIDDDGFCSSCGRRGTTARDHWTETPADWVGAVCDKGIAHLRNEDAMAVTADDHRAIVVVCDGVTSAPESDRASIAAARMARDVLAAAQPMVVGPPEEQRGRWESVLVDACRRANGEAVAVAHVLGDPPEPPSCTFVAAVVDLGAGSGDPDDPGVLGGDVAIVSVAWCGDSRAYWLPDGGAGRQLGLDHSVGTELIAAGMAPEMAAVDPQFHTITRWLGADSIEPRPETLTVTLDEPGWVLVCSDGLWNYAADATHLRSLLDEAAQHGATTPTSLAESLAAWANEQGGHDNITVGLVRFDGRLP